MDGWRPSDVSDICYGSQRIITIVGTAMKHGRHLAGIGLERFGNGKDVRLLAKAPPSVVEEYGFRSVKKCALAEGQLASIAFLMSLSTLHPYMNCCQSPTKYKQLARRRNTIYSMHHRRILTHLAGSQECVSPAKIM